MQYDSIQLLVGSLLFAITLFLFTTILAYHVFFAVCSLIVSFTMDGISGVVLLLKEWPAGVLITRCFYRQWPAKHVYLQEKSSHVSTSSVSVTTLRTTSDSTSVSLAKSLQVPLSKLFKLLYLQVQDALFGSKSDGCLIL